MAVNSERLRLRGRHTGSETEVRFDEDTGFVLRHTRLYDDEQLASESFVAYPVER